MSYPFDKCHSARAELVFESRAPVETPDGSPATHLFRLYPNRGIIKGPMVHRPNVYYRAFSFSAAKNIRTI